MQLIRCDGGTQSRAFNSEPAIDEYKEAMLRGVEFDPIVVFFDGEDYWLADGFHRVRAARDGEIESLPADVREGTKRDAVLYSVGANAKHGVKRTNDDKRRAVKMLLDDEEWSKNNPQWIADKCGVSHTFVQNVLKESEFATVANSYRIGKDGKSYPSKKAGRERSAPPLLNQSSGAPSFSPQSKSNGDGSIQQQPAPPERGNLDQSTRPAEALSPLERSETPDLPQRNESDGSNWQSSPSSLHESELLVRYAVENESRMRDDPDFLSEWLERARRVIQG
ncbi:MAG: ParB/RepB/Spo0J family partition protein [Armatimonadetes bacterium]|nr:ParB/RepB/Spo0J family partition protein [Armatimonadota bacterium]